jgi:hypothetical protein
LNECTAPNQPTTTTPKQAALRSKRERNVMAKRKTTYQPLIDGVDAKAESRSRADNLRVQTNTPKNTSSYSGNSQTHAYAQSVASVIAEMPPGTTRTPFLYVAQDLRSIQYSGFDHPDHAPAVFDWMAMLEMEKPHLKFHRLTPALWRTISDQLNAAWPTMDAAEKSKLIDRIDVLLDFVRSQQWEVDDGTDLEAAP